MGSCQKKFFTIIDQIEAFKNAGLVVENEAEAFESLTLINYYSLKSFSCHLFDAATKKYRPGTSSSDILKIYDFNVSVSGLLFQMIGKIEVSLRAHFANAFLIYENPFLYKNLQLYKDNKRFIENDKGLSFLINSSYDTVIKHELKANNGQLPVWAMVEVTTFGLLSKMISNLNTKNAIGKSIFSSIANHYKYINNKGVTIQPGKDLITSWIHVVSILRNICAHNARIYNRSIPKTPRLLKIDRIEPKPKTSKIYQGLLAMKYLRSSDKSWRKFFKDLCELIEESPSSIDLTSMNFPEDWFEHLTLQS